MYPAPTGPNMITKDDVRLAVNELRGQSWDLTEKRELATLWSRINLLSDDALAKILANVTTQEAQDAEFFVQYLRHQVAEAGL